MERGLSRNLNFDRRGGLRTLRYMLKERRARLACGTYLLAYAIFSVYMPLAKNKTRVVIATNNKPLAIYGGSTT